MENKNEEPARPPPNEETEQDKTEQFSLKAQTLNYAEEIIKTGTQPFLVLDGNRHILQTNLTFNNC